MSSFLCSKRQLSLLVLLISFTCTPSQPFIFLTSFTFPFFLFSCLPPLPLHFPPSSPSPSLLHLPPLPSFIFLPFPPLFPSPSLLRLPPLSSLVSLSLPLSSLLRLPPLHSLVSLPFPPSLLPPSPLPSHLSLASSHLLFSRLLECQRPNRDHLRRLDTQLTVWILEARNLQPKKRYYCEIYLNGILYALTCCKMMNEILFWGEPFVFE